MSAEPLTLGAAVLAGFLGSGHCLGMCGGIAVLPGARAGGGSRSQLFIYNVSRLLSYSILGALVGFLGASVGEVLDVPRWSVILRLATGLVVVFIGLALWSGNTRWAFAERLGARLWRRVAPLATRMSSWPTGLRLASLGLLWGLLPCGLVYSLLLAASVSGSAQDGALTMAAFGLGTLPSMLGLGLVGQAAVQKLRLPSVRRAAAVVLIISGLWLAAMPIWHMSGSAGQHDHSAGAL
jgi:sulfite exporter TauE/SafE